MSYCPLDSGEAKNVNCVADWRPVMFVNISVDGAE